MLQKRGGHRRGKRADEILQITSRVETRRATVGWGSSCARSVWFHPLLRVYATGSALFFLSTSRWSLSLGVARRPSLRRCDKGVARLTIHDRRFHPPFSSTFSGRSWVVLLSSGGDMPGGLSTFNYLAILYLASRILLKSRSSFRGILKIK